MTSAQVLRQPRALFGPWPGLLVWLAMLALDDRIDLARIFRAP
jgi:hypothetical protein